MGSHKIVTVLVRKRGGKWESPSNRIENLKLWSVSGHSGSPPYFPFWFRIVSYNTVRGVVSFPSLLSLFPST